MQLRRCIDAFAFFNPTRKIGCNQIRDKKIREHTTIGSLEKSIVDNVFRDKVTPVVGSILHCSFFGAEHTGIYIGDNKIVELTGSGSIRVTSPDGFIVGTNAISIYVACDGTQPLGGNHIAERARGLIVYLAISKTLQTFLLLLSCVLRNT
jgi:hypothetical protein